MKLLSTGYIYNFSERMILDNGGYNLETQKSIEEQQKITVPQFLFVIGLFAKQFYLLPSGSLQVGDLILMLGCFMHLMFTKKGRILVERSNLLLLVYVLLVAIINFVYYAALHNKSFIWPIFYYLYNLVIVISFSSFIRMDNSNLFLSKIGLVLKTSLVLQLALLLSGIGRWAYVTRYSGSFNDPNQYGVFIFFSVLMIYLVDQCTNKKRWVLWCILGTVLVFPSTSTGTMLGFIVFWVGLYLSSVKSLKNEGKILWGFLLLAFITLFVLLQIGKLPLPQFIASNKMYSRVISKITKIASTSDSSTLLSDRGWTRVIKSPQYFLFGAGEGGYERFGTWLEIHSSIIGPMFYYGIFPFMLFISWVLKKLRATECLFVYLALFSEAIFLANTRQPLYWMLIIMGSYPALKSQFSNRVIE